MKELSHFDLTERKINQSIVTKQQTFPIFNLIDILNLREEWP